jgi:hypothetical protein
MNLLNRTTVTACFLTIQMLALSSGASAQSTGALVTSPEGRAWETRHFVLEATTLSISPQIYGSLRGPFQAGVAVGLGPVLAVPFAEEDYCESEDLVEASHAGLLVAWRFAKLMGIEVSPLRASLMVGNDWGQIYPSAHVRLFAAGSRVRVSSQITVVRIAGGDGSGIYPVLWTPVLVAVNF